MQEKLEIILLAAGCSSRLGQAKQLVKFGKHSLLYRQAAMALDVNHKVSCVIGFEAQRMSAELQSLPVNIIVNQQWQFGLASSIACGVNQLQSNTDGVLLMLVDQWQVTADDIHRLIARWRQEPNKIISANKDVEGVKKMTLGPPVIFPRQCFPELKQLAKGQGAKAVINAHLSNVIPLSIQHAFVDLDTPEDLVAFKRYFNAQ